MNTLAMIGFFIVLAAMFITSWWYNKSVGNMRPGMHLWPRVVGCALLVAVVVVFRSPESGPWPYLILLLCAWGLYDGYRKYRKTNKTQEAGA